LTSINHDYTEKNFVKIFKKLLTKYRSKDNFMLDHQNSYAENSSNAKNVLLTNVLHNYFDIDFNKIIFRSVSS